MRDGLVGKVHAFRLIYLNLSFALSSFLLVGIHKDWSTGLNLSTLPEDWLNLAKFFFSLKKEKKDRFMKKYFYFYFSEGKSIFVVSSDL